MASSTPATAKAQRTTKDPSVKKEAQRQKPSAKVQKLLYVRAGGRCQICNDYVLESTDLGFYPFNRGEMAHIVGQSLDDKSPRSNYPLAKELRDNIDNFLLLCAMHHQTIDNAIAQKNFTVELLREIKRRQENHIYHVTGIPHSSSTCIVRLIGRIRGKTVQLTAAECNGATLHHTTPRFADFALDLHRQGTEIDLTLLGEPEEDPEFYYRGARKIIVEKLAIIRQGVESGHIEHLSVFGFARIPVLAFLGFSLGNKVGSTLFQRRRVDEKHWHWLPDAPVQNFEWLPVQTGSNPLHVAIIVNVSGSIHRQELPPHIDDTYTVFLIRPTGVAPNPDAVLSVASLDEFRKCYRNWLAYLETEHKFTPAIHLFPAVPPAVAVSIGLDLMPHSQPSIVVYDRMPHDFYNVLVINEK
ncbi:SAVED domain-containing protein [Hymenobacter metallicola]|uniref:SAVED domain-containing protein n=1 Tax=Hymenobacter metallicola TaxID=2563114 RepID=A0A4Z0PT51_9BACT|nr:SAVED domain-containing protein [Hymenobacter metallicola]TGE20897.1 SAVED domain-containing protein [Hymenobacter metallicola]